MNKHVEFDLVALPFNQEFYFIIISIFVCTKIFISVTIGKFDFALFLALKIIFKSSYRKMEITVLTHIYVKNNNGNHWACR